MQSPESRPQPVFHALFISDVLHLICDLLEVSDWMSLMLTCKPMFATAASHIWANLDGVQVLTDLLVETTAEAGGTTTV
ncbi:hypothetical protein BDV93DRAFT_100583 [Ceratobasidium sp. AG-I]|nr:hypothetical protein BDV93DRAFT_100583 [Ceratobasidium sp. AG-I]